jgi:hypothetical protein
MKQNPTVNTEVKNNFQTVSKFFPLFFRDSQAGAFLSRGVLSTAKPKHKVLKPGEKLY